MATVAMRILVAVSAAWRGSTAGCRDINRLLAWLKRLPPGLGGPVHIVDVGCSG
jgi:hypothetical protein